MEWFREHAWETWLAIAVLLGVAEMFSLDLVLAMLALGAVVGMVLAFADVAVWIQVLGAGAAATAALTLARPSMVKRLHGGPELTLGHSKLVGHQAVVTQEVSGLEVGRIRLAGEVWTAVPYDETATIAVGETVEVMEIRGATAVVYPVARLES